MFNYTKFKLNTFHLKIIAVLIMVVDHIAYIMIPSSEPIYLIMRSVGRISAPLFWYGFVEGYRRTSNAARYKQRLAIGAIVMGVGNEIVTLFPTQNLPTMSFLTPNMFLTFLLMAIVIDSIEHIKNKKSILEILFSCSVLMMSLYVVISFADYGWLVTSSILCLYFLKNKTIKYTLFVVVNLFICMVINNAMQMFMVIAVLPMLLCSNQKPKHNMKWFFYLFYPLHFWFLCLIQIMISQ